MDRENPEHYRLAPLSNDTAKLKARVEKLEKQVVSLYQMIERRDKKIKRLERGLRDT